MIGAAYGSAGERCMAVSVGVAVGHIADELVEKLKRASPAARPRRHGGRRRHGPVVTAVHRQKILDYIESGIAGAKLVCDGRRHTVSGRGMALRRDTVRPRAPRDEDLPRDLRPGSDDRARTRFRRCLELVNAHEFGNGVACDNVDSGTAREFSRRVSRHGRNQRAVPVLMSFHRSAVALRRPPRLWREAVRHTRYKT
jgi:malonate-semialdehyde dehydrogenase (acetylating)/methylmalonate-semialdehyde dehydrogenase